MFDVVSVPAPDPSPDPSPDSTSQAPSLPKAAPTGPWLLVIEDDPFSRQALARLLNRGGYTVTAFATIAEATDWLTSADAAGVRIDGAVIDIHLPDGDGIELTRLLRRRLGSGPRIVVVSGDTTMPTLNRLKDAGADGFIGKPLRFQVLLEALFPKEDTKAGS